MNLSREQIEQLKADIYYHSVASLDKPVDAEGEELTIRDTIPSHEDVSGSVLEGLAAEELRSDLWGAVDSLGTDYSQAIRNRYQGNMSLQAVGDSMGISREQVRNYEAKGLRRLRLNKTVKQIGEDYGYLRHHVYHKYSYDRFQRTWTSATEYEALRMWER